MSKRGSLMPASQQQRVQISMLENVRQPSIPPGCQSLTSELRDSHGNPIG